MPSYTESAMEVRNKIARHTEQLATLEAREAETDLDTDGYDLYANPELVAGTGVVTPPGQVRYSRPYASMRMGMLSWADVTVSRDAHEFSPDRGYTVMDSGSDSELLRPCPTWGWALDDDGKTAILTDDNRPTVKVIYRDGSWHVRPVSEYRKLYRERKAAKREQRKAAVVSERDARTARDLALIGNAGDAATYEL